MFSTRVLVGAFSVIVKLQSLLRFVASSAAHVWSGGGALFVSQQNTKHPEWWWWWWWHQKAVAVVWRLRALVYRIIMILITMISGGLGNTLSSQPANYLRFLEGGTKLFVYHKKLPVPSDTESESPIKRIFVLSLFVTRKVRCQVRNLMRNLTLHLHWACFTYIYWKIILFVSENECGSAGKRRLFLSPEILFSKSSTSIPHSAHL